MMIKNTRTTDISQALRELKQNDALRSETDRLRDIFDDVEAALKSGVKREVVLSTLHEKGFTMKMTSFKSALQRIRKEKAQLEATK
ncbi:hypothetical protein ACO0LB_17775 [Undibacterium sp. SXout7W]|uniref:hypothetical protein n=1 Tax=Undibacterium sp. SXout7W TaxID=3413049 RepID=UPI003BF3FF0B